MLDDHGSLPTPVELRSWAGTLPPFAADVVAGSDITQPHLYLHLPAEPGEIRVVRSKITDWTDQVGLPAVDGQDVVLATDEAVSNAVEHAYPDTRGTLTLFAARARLANAVRIIVSDRGLWRPPAADPGFRGRGLSMMECLAHMFRLAHTPKGTTVVLGWSLPA